MEKEISEEKTNEKTSLKDMYENSFGNKNIKVKSTKENKENTKTDSFTVEELKNYYFNFTSKYKEIYNSLEKIKTECELITNMDQDNKDKYTKKLNESEKEISSLKLDFDNNSMFLVSHDRNNYLNIIDELNSEVDQIKLILNPKKKFKFSNRKNENDGNQTSKNNEEKPIKKEIKNFYSDQDLVLSNLTQKILFEEVSNKTSLFIDDVSDSILIFKNKFKSLFIRNLKNSLLIVPLVSGGTHITGCEHSEIYLYTHQLRIHHCNYNTIYIHCISSPIIEHCTNMGFGDLHSINNLKSEISDFIKQIIEEENSNTNSNNSNKFKDIQDFQWLKNEKSPNYDIIPDISSDNKLNRKLCEFLNKKDEN